MHPLSHFSLLVAAMEPSAPVGELLRNWDMEGPFLVCCVAVSSELRRSVLSHAPWDSGTRASEMVQWARVLAAKPHYLSLILGTHMVVEGENQLPQFMHRTQDARGARVFAGSLPCQTSSNRSWGKGTPVAEAPTSGAGGSRDETCEL